MKRVSRTIRMPQKPLCKPDYVPGRNRATVIHLGRCSRNASSHLPAAGPGRSVGCLFDVAPRRDCPFHPTRSRLVSVALIRASRRTGVTCYGALRSPDFPPAAHRPPTTVRMTFAARDELYRIFPLLVESIRRICNFSPPASQLCNGRCGTMVRFRLLNRQTFFLSAC